MRVKACFCVAILALLVSFNLLGCAGLTSKAGCVHRLLPLLRRACNVSALHKMDLVQETEKETAKRSAQRCSSLSAAFIEAYSLLFGHRHRAVFPLYFLQTWPFARHAADAPCRDGA